MGINKLLFLHQLMDQKLSIFLALFSLFSENYHSSSNLCHFLMNRATVMSLVAYERSFKADLLPLVVFKIILSENGDIWVERWTKTFVLGCSLPFQFFESACRKAISHR